MSLRDNPNIVDDVSDIRRDLDELAVAVTSDGSVTTNMLADEAVTSDKIDFTTLNYSVGVGTDTSDITLSSTKQAILTTGTLPTGTYLAWGEYYYNKTSGTPTGDYFWDVATSASTADANFAESTTGHAWTHGGRAFARVITITTPSTLSIFGWRSQTDGTVITRADRCSLLVLRVG